MKDTHFFPPESKLARLASVYTPSNKGGIEKLAEGVIVMGSVIFSTNYLYDGSRQYFSGGAGLASTATDYARFLQMMLNDGEFQGTRLLSRKTVELMTVNHISELDISAEGFKFGLGFAVHEGPGRSGSIGSIGDYLWGGFFNTRFWVDPQEQMIGVLMTQLYPHDHTDIRNKLRVLAYQAIVD